MLQQQQQQQQQQASGGRLVACGLCVHWWVGGWAGGRVGLRAGDPKAEADMLWRHVDVMAAS